MHHGGAPTAEASAKQDLPQLPSSSHPPCPSQASPQPASGETPPFLFSVVPPELWSCLLRVM